MMYQVHLECAPRAVWVSLVFYRLEHRENHAQYSGNTCRLVAHSASCKHLAMWVLHKRFECTMYNHLSGCWIGVYIFCLYCNKIHYSFIAGTLVYVSGFFYTTRTSEAGHCQYYRCPGAIQGIPDSIVHGANDNINTKYQSYFGRFQHWCESNKVS